jgi:hypothetical protein
MMTAAALRLANGSAAVGKTFVPSCCFLLLRCAGQENFKIVKANWIMPWSYHVISDLRLRR